MYAVSEMVNIHFIVTCRVYCLIIVFLYIISLTWNDLYLVYIFKSYFSIFYLGFFPNLIYFLHFEPLIESQKSDASSMQLGEVRTSNNLDTGPATKTLTRSSKEYNRNNEKSLRRHLYMHCRLSKAIKIRVLRHCKSFRRYSSTFIWWHLVVGFKRSSIQKMYSKILERNLYAQVHILFPTSVLAQFRILRACLQ